MPNARITNAVANSGIRNLLPNVRSTRATFSTEGSSSGGLGSPIGLLLALTYASSTSTTNSSDYRPNIRIR